MKKSASYFQRLFAGFLSLYAGLAFAFVDPPTFVPMAPNSAQPIVVSVRSGICHAFVIPRPSDPPLRVEKSPGIIDIFAPGIINPDGFCNIPILTAPLASLSAQPAGNYQVRVWIMDVGGFFGTVLVTSAPLTVTQGPVIQISPVPTLGFTACLILVSAILLIVWLVLYSQ